MYEIIYSETASKQLKKLDKPIQERIIGTLERIRSNPEMYVRKLVGIEGYRFRVGDYRIIMDINNKQLQILVLKFGNRKNIYD